MKKDAVDLKKLVFLLFFGACFWIFPVPEGLSIKAWHLFGIFITTILAIILNPIPIGAIAMISILASIITDTLSISNALKGFASHIAWLVVFAFFISRGFIKTGLGKRIAYYFISKIGKSTLGLSYGLVFTDFILSPMIPSVTARSGGIIFPIAKSLADEYGSNLETSNRKNKSGGFLMQVCFQANVITSAMFLTAMAGNPTVQGAAASFGIEITWATWALGGIVPGVINLALMPFLLFKIYPPSIKHTKDAPMRAKKALAEMGRISKQEIIMIATFLGLISLWIFGKTIGIDSTVTALLGFVVILITGVLTWEDVLAEKGAWDTLTWFGTLIMISEFLKEFGMMDWLGGRMSTLVDTSNLIMTITILVSLYFFAHYIFASITAKIMVLYSAFLMLFLKAGAAAMASAMMLGYLSSLAGGLTHFGISSAPIYFGSGYLSTKKWWKIGLIIGTANLFVWMFFGNIWWYALGWW